MTNELPTRNRFTFVIHNRRIGGGLYSWQVIVRDLLTGEIILDRILSSTETRAWDFARNYVRHAELNATVAGEPITVPA